MRNLVLISIVAGGLHGFLYTLRMQGNARRFDARGLARKSKKFTWNDQVLDNVFWTCVSGVTVWTAYEVLYVWAHANGYLPAIAFGTHLIGFLLWFLLIPIWSSLHFYWIHRALYWSPLYRLAHSLHDRNVTIGPWTGISMHPIEHVLYFSSVLIHFVVASHPVHFIIHMPLQALNPSASHSGFESLVVNGKARMQPGDCFHQLHHRYFDCNYGTAEMPWDKWFGSFHNDTRESWAAIKQRRRRTATNQ